MVVLYSIFVAVTIVILLLVLSVMIDRYRIHKLIKSHNCNMKLFYDFLEYKNAAFLFHSSMYKLDSEKPNNFIIDNIDELINIYPCHNYWEELNSEWQDWLELYNKYKQIKSKS